MKSSSESLRFDHHRNRHQDPGMKASVYRLPSRTCGLPSVDNSGRRDNHCALTGALASVTALGARYREAPPNDRMLRRGEKVDRSN